MDDLRPDHRTWRHRVLATLLIVMMAALLGRLAQIQLINHNRYLEEAAITRYGAVSVAAPRGAIIDATGYPIATSVDTWDIYLDSFLWRDREQALEAARDLAAALDLDAATVFDRGTSQELGDVILVRDIEYRQGLELQRQGLWGVRALPSSVRAYPAGDLASQLIGYVGLDGGGLWGIEADYDVELRGQPGRIVSERDTLGRPIAFAQRAERAPEAGGEVHLTLDRFIQTIIERALDAALEQYEAPSGSILVMDPRTGGVLAIASRPASALTPQALEDRQLADLVRNRVVTDLYEPGSVFKTLTAAAALDLGRVTPDTTYVDEGRVEIGDRTIRNWDFQAYGEVTVTELLQRSLNTGAVWLAEEIGADDFYDYLAAFGIGEQTHIGLSGESDGIIRTPADDDWYPIDLATNSYGQGLAATPLQVLTAVNVFANDGKLMRPYIVSKIVTENRVREFDPVEVRQVISPATARTMADLMLAVVEGVQWHGARVPGYRVAGKTGTTIVSVPTGYDFDTTIATFAGFLPYEAPRISVLVKIDQPGVDRNLGGQVAAPVFAGLAAEIMKYLEEPTTVVRMTGR
ncbi:MAG TPA: penicillin-binding protein 2 [Dehalococcoidia bacterium]|nr:penicillin-binding protein 2 [Dehalococcoidia bacterium]